MLQHLIRINRNLLFAAEKQLRTVKYVGAIEIKHLDVKKDSTEEDVLRNIDELTSILKFPEDSYNIINYGSYARRNIIDSTKV
jgi:hypothetical protein